MVKIAFVIVVGVLGVSAVFLGTQARNDAPVPQESKQIPAVDQDRLEDVVREYVKMSRASDLEGIKSLITLMPPSYRTYHIRKAAEEDGVPYVPPTRLRNAEELIAYYNSPEVKAQFEATTKDDPKWIESKKLYIRRVLGEWKTETEGRVKVEFGSEVADSLPRSAPGKFKFPLEMDFWLLKENGVWRIYMMMVTDSSVTYPF